MKLHLTAKLKKFVDNIHSNNTLYIIILNVPEPNVEPEAVEGAPKILLLGAGVVALLPKAPKAGVAVVTAGVAPNGDVDDEVAPKAGVNVLEVVVGAPNIDDPEVAPLPKILVVELTVDDPKNDPDEEEDGLPNVEEDALPKGAFPKVLEVVEVPNKGVVDGVELGNDCAPKTFELVVTGTVDSLFEESSFLVASEPKAGAVLATTASDLGANVAWA